MQPSRLLLEIIIVAQWLHMHAACINQVQLLLNRAPRQSDNCHTLCCPRECFGGQFMRDEQKRILARLVAKRAANTSLCAASSRKAHYLACSKHKSLSFFKSFYYFHLFNKLLTCKFYCRKISMAFLQFTPSENNSCKHFWVFGINNDFLKFITQSLSDLNFYKYIKMCK